MSTKAVSYPDQTADSSIGTGTAFDRTETSTGIDQNVAGALSYLLGPLTGVLFYALERENEFVRFHAAQSMVVSGVLIALGLLTIAASMLLFAVDAFITGGVIAVLASLGISLAWLAISAAAFVAWLYLMVRAYQGKRTALPVLGKYAERMT